MTRAVVNLHQPPAVAKSIGGANANGGRAVPTLVGVLQGRGNVARLSVEFAVLWNEGFPVS